MESSSASRVVLLLDDDECNLHLFEKALKPSGYTLVSFRDPNEALSAITHGMIPDLIISDILMPGMDGFALCATLRERPDTQRVPIVLLTALGDIESKIRGLEAGADDFITKPFSPLELRARVRSMMRIKSLTDELETANRLLSAEKGELELLIAERTKELEDLTFGIVAALERANALHDSETGLHIHRVCAYAYVLAIELGLGMELAGKIRRFASLHDVGKVGVSEKILKKEGVLTTEESERMKKHTNHGHELLDLANAPQIAKNIALSHHERFDGTGYPNGLRGKEIPIEARIVALADVFDAMTTKRCYKDAATPEEAFSFIVQESGRQFDPDVVNAMLRTQNKFIEIGKKYRNF